MVRKPEAGGAGTVWTLLGYAGVADVQLRNGGGAGTMLSRCPACDGGLIALSRHGGKFDLIRGQICSTDLMSGTGTIIFLEGVNDDILWVHDRMDYWSDARAASRFVRVVTDGTVGARHLQLLLDHLETSSLHAGDRQAA